MHISLLSLSHREFQILSDNLDKNPAKQTFLVLSFQNVDATTSIICNYLDLQPALAPTWTLGLPDPNKTNINGTLTEQPDPQ